MYHSFASSCKGGEIYAFHGIVHRDLKPENILCQTNGIKEIKMRILEYLVIFGQKYVKSGRISKKETTKTVRTLQQKLRIICTTT